MKRRVSLTAGRRLNWLVPLGVLVLLTGVAGAADRLLIPGDMDLPFYQRGLGHAVTDDGIWVGTVFYRPFDKKAPKDIACNQFVFDIDSTKYPLCVEGFVVMKEGASGPITMTLTNRPNEVVPICFALAEDYLPAMLDKDGTTIGELWKMPSLIVGYADFYLEIQQPFDPDQPGVGFNHDVIASGVLEDGRPFFVRSIYTGSGSDDGIGAYNVDFRFGD